MSFDVNAGCNDVYVCEETKGVNKEIESLIKSDFQRRCKACSGLSDVLLVKRLADESLAALRILPTEKMDYEKIKEEVWFLKWLSHPCIISVNQIISVGSDVYVFSIYCDLCLFFENNYTI
ncbi:hypothetical protein WUBG_11594 [Wuchereria bancrofti]|uniref:Protein kinase domain-containing protein n=1 Tax=Wuchereria bancrofti TaxID=6293 RepID=J9E5D2_WUCBA|nr:hypothetical protein WUBG_11594 [Wuchereria bancrofti]